MSLTIFAKKNVNLHLFAFRIAPGWMQNVNSITIVIGGPLNSFFSLGYDEKRKRLALLPLQYSTGLFLSSLSLLILPPRHCVRRSTEIRGLWLLVCNLCKGTAELLISPIGYLIVRQLIPTRCKDCEWERRC